MEQLRLQIEAHEKEDASRSVLKRAVGSVSSVFVKDDASLEQLRITYREQQKNVKDGKVVDTAAIQRLIKNDRDAAQTQSEVVQYGSQFLKTGGLFMRGRFGLAGTIGLYMLDQINPGDSFKDQLIDATLGAAKGGLMKGSFVLMGNKPVGIAAKGVGLGVSSRILELGLTRQTYMDPTTGKFSFGKGLAETLHASLNKTALATDVVVFGAAHGLLRGANSAMLGRIDKSPMLTTVLTGTTFGWSSGATGEVMRQSAAGEQFDLGKIVKRSLIQGALDSLAATPGGVQSDPNVQGRLRGLARSGLDGMRSQVAAVKSSFAELGDSAILSGGLTPALAGMGVPIETLTGRPLGDSKAEAVAMSMHDRPAGPGGRGHQASSAKGDGTPEPDAAQWLRPTDAEAKSVLDRRDSRPLSQTEGLTLDEANAIAVLRQQNKQLPRELSERQDKAGWQARAVEKYHTYMTDSNGVIKPEMFERLDNAWLLKEALEHRLPENLEWCRNCFRAQELAIVDGVQNESQLQNYWKVVDVTSTLFMNERLEPGLLGPARNAFAQQPFIDRLSRDEMHSGLRRYVVTGEMPDSAETIRAAISMWYLDSSLPTASAIDFNSKPLLEQLTAASAWNRVLADRGVKRRGGGVISPEDRIKIEWSDAAVRSSFDHHFRELSRLGRATIVSNLGGNNAIVLRNALRIVHGDALSKHEQDQLIDAFVGESVQPTKVIPSIKAAHFKQALALLEQGKLKLRGSDSAKGAARLASIFKGGAGQWLEVQAKIGRNEHDATYWLVLDSSQNSQGLGQYLFAHAERPIPQLEIVARNWSQMTAVDRQLPFAELVQKLRSNTYKDRKDREFASEAAQWGVKQEDYAEFESRYLRSLDIPVPFPLEKSWQAGDLVGRFLPRNDPRGLFLGQHTNCCQHPYGQGSSSAWHGQENPNSGFFVVEDGNHNIVAQSWTWVGKYGGLVFDNVEAKGLGSRERAVQQIYSSAAQELAPKFGLVTLGTGSSDIDVSRWQNAGGLAEQLPANQNAYSDASDQVILAEHTERHS